MVKLLRISHIPPHASRQDHGKTLLSQHDVGRVASVRACYIAGMRFFAKEDWVLYSWRPLSMRTRVRIWIRENLRERGLRPMNVVIAELVRDWFDMIGTQT